MKTITLVISTIFVIFLLMGTAAAANGNFAANPNAPSAYGTATNPYIIEDADDLNAVRNNLSAHYKIKEGTIIDLDGINWVPIGTNTTPFRGSFDGNNDQDSKIINMTITDNRRYVGLFGMTLGTAANPVILKNITVENVDIEIMGTNFFIGTLAGNCNNTEISNCNAIGEINATESSQVGGLVGDHANGIVKNCHTDVEISGNGYVGGLIGNVSRSFAIQDSSANGNINVNVDYVGGLIGFLYYFEGTIENCSATGDIAGRNNVGGLIGRQESYTQITLVDNCFATGNIAGNSTVGGFIGQSSNNYIQISNSYATGDVNANGSAGGFAGMITDAVNCSAAGNVISRTGYAGGFAATIAGVGVTDCFATGNVRAYTHAGGLAGNIGFADAKNCYATGNVFSETNNAGGLFGHTSYDETGGINVSKCFATGEVSAANGYAGGLIGNTSLMAIIDNSFSTGNVSGKVAGGLVGRGMTVIVENCYATGNIDGTEYAGGLFGKLFAPPFDKSSYYSQFNYVGNCMVLCEYINGSKADSIGFYEMEMDQLTDYFGTESAEFDFENIYVWNGVQNGVQDGTDVLNYGELTNDLTSDAVFVKSYHVWDRYGNTSAYQPQPGETGSDSVWDKAIWDDTIWKIGSNANFKLPVLQGLPDPSANAVHLLYLTQIDIFQGKNVTETSTDFVIMLDAKEVNYSHEFFPNWDWTDLYVEYGALETKPEVIKKINEDSGNLISFFSITLPTENPQTSVEYDMTQYKGIDPLYAWAGVKMEDTLNGYNTKRLGEKNTFTLETLPGGGGGNNSSGGSSGGSGTGNAQIIDSEEKEPEIVSPPEGNTDEPKPPVIIEPPAPPIVILFFMVAIAIFVYTQNREIEKRRDENN